MDASKVETEKQFKGNVGIFLVAAKLSQMNLIALTTSRNTKGYDIVVMNPKTNRGTGIEVKCTDRKDYPIMQSFLTDYEQEIAKKIVADYVFVDISDSDRPRFFVVPMKEMRGLLQGIMERYKKKRELEETLKTENKKQNWTMKLDLIEKYENNWKALTEKI